jgi:hypothetical protein
MRWLWISCALVAVIAAAWLALRGSDRERAAPRPAAPAAVADAEHARDDAIEPLEDVAADEREIAQVPLATADTAPSSEATEVGFEVRVIDLLDAPVAGARVRLESDEELPAQITDADGRCRISRAFGLTGHSVAIDAEGFYPLRTVVRSIEKLEIRLHRLVRLSGRVLERDTRAPIAGARLCVPWGADDGEARAVLSDARGAFADLDVPAGVNFFLAVRAAGHIEPGRRESTRKVRPEDPDPRLDVLLEPALVGEFLVVDDASGDPVADASVAVGSVKYVTDAHGRVQPDRSLRPDAASHRISVQAEGYCWTTFEVERVGDEAEPCVLRLPLATRIAGILRDAQGSPAEGMTIVARLDEALVDELRRSGRPPSVLATAAWPAGASWVRNLERPSLEAEQQGRFAIEGLPPGLPSIDLDVLQGERILERRSVGPLGAAGSTLELDWRLRPSDGGSLSGRLLLNGEPHAGFVSWRQGEHVGEARVESDGAFVFEDLAAGPLELTGQYWGPWTSWGPGARPVATVQVAAGERAQQDLAVEIAVVTIRGSLSAVDGSAAPGVAVRAVGSSRHHTTTAADGTWTLHVADVPEPYRIECALPLREQGLEVRAGAENVALHVCATGTLRYRTREVESGRTIASIGVLRFDSPGQRATVAHPAFHPPDTDGWTTVDVPEGEHEFLAYSTDAAWLPERRTLRITAGAVSEVEFRFVAAQSLSVRLDPEGAPFPAGHGCLLLPEDDWPLVEAEWRDGGARVDYGALLPTPGVRREPALRPGSIDTLRGLAPGRYRFKVFPDDIAITPEWIDVPADGVVEVQWAAKP